MPRTPAKPRRLLRGLSSLQWLLEQEMLPRERRDPYRPFVVKVDGRWSVWRTRGFSRSLSGLLTSEAVVADGLRHQMFFGHGGSAVGDPEVFVRRGHQSGLCEFFRDMRRQWGFMLSDAHRDGLSVSPSRYHDPDPMTMREAMGPRSAAAMTDFDVLWESFFPSHRF